MRKKKYEWQNNGGHKSQSLHQGLVGCFEWHLGIADPLTWYSPVASLRWMIVLCFV